MPAPPSAAIDESAMQAGIELADWFGGEARRVYSLFSESDDDRESRELVDLIRRRGGTITASKLRASSRHYRAPGKAEAALEALAKAKVGRWEVVPTATKPRQEFTLHGASAVSDSRIPPESRRNETADSHSDPGKHTGNGGRP